VTGGIASFAQFSALLQLVNDAGISGMAIYVPANAIDSIGGSGCIASLAAGGNAE